jgi:predicted transcriptional regulator
MKVAVSIPDDLFQLAEKLAHDLDLSRSALYAKALRELVERLRDEAVTAQLNAALAAGKPQVPDPLMQRTAYMTAKRAGGSW